jgi:RES domain-containing protein
MDGEGARINGGRWNPVGTPMVYCAGSLALAALETLVHVGPANAPTDLMAITVELEDSSLEEIHVSALPPNWRDTPAPAELARRGKEWIDSGRTVVLKVPSAIVPVESNYLLSPDHPDYRAIVKLGPVEPFLFDPRLRSGAGKR